MHSTYVCCIEQSSTSHKACIFLCMYANLHDHVQHEWSNHQHTLYFTTKLVLTYTATHASRTWQSSSEVRLPQLPDGWHYRQQSGNWGSLTSEHTRLRPSPPTPSPALVRVLAGWTLIWCGKHLCSHLDHLDTAQGKY